MTDCDASEESRGGRPRASSPETLAEAACELFLERGFAQTSIADIATRAGVSRSSFFNYFASKSDILWGAFDRRSTEVVERLADARTPVDSVLAAFGHGFPPDNLALAIANAEAMGLEDELIRERAVRQAGLAAAIVQRLRGGAADELRAEITAAAYAGAVMAAIWRWAALGSGHTDLGEVLATALAGVGETLGDGTSASGGQRAVRQLRVVARADHFEGALRFYRDVLGMPEREAYQGDGGARVVILDAGRATLELSNAAQIDLIDRVETDGDAPSEPVRIAFEVADTAAATAHAVGAGALLEATPRETPWRSVNSRLRAPAGLQVTLFQELGDATASSSAIPGP